MMDATERARRKMLRQMMMSASNVANGVSTSSSFAVRAYGKKMFVTVAHPSDEGDVIIDCTGHETRLLVEGDL